MNIKDFLNKIEDEAFIGEVQIKDIPIRCLEGGSTSIAYSNKFHYDEKLRKFFLDSPQIFSITSEQFNKKEEFSKVLFQILKDKYWYIDKQYQYSEKNGAMFMYYSVLDDNELELIHIEKPSMVGINVGTNVLIANTFSDEWQKLLITNQNVAVDFLSNTIGLKQQEIIEFVDKEQKPIDFMPEPVVDDTYVEEIKVDKTKKNKRKKDVSVSNLEELFSEEIIDNKDN